MKVSYTVTAQTAQKEWTRTVGTKAQADALAAEWTARYRAQCTVTLRETGFLVGGGRYDTTKTVGKTETADAARARKARNILRCRPGTTPAEIDRLMKHGQVMDGDFDRGTLERILAR